MRVGFSGDDTKFLPANSPQLKHVYSSTSVGQLKSMVNAWAFEGDPRKARQEIQLTYDGVVFSDDEATLGEKGVICGTVIELVKIQKDVIEEEEDSEDLPPPLVDSTSSPDDEGGLETDMSD